MFEGKYAEIPNSPSIPLINLSTLKPFSHLLLPFAFRVTDSCMLLQRCYCSC